MGAMPAKTPRRRPRRDRLPLAFYTHPFELALGAALVLNGFQGLLGEVLPSVAELPEVTRVLYLVVSVLGGVGTLVGVILNDPPTHINLSLAVERAALILVAVSYAVLAVIIVGRNGADGVATTTVSLVIAAACLLRVVAIRRAATIILEQLVERTRQQDGGPHE